MKPKKRNTNTYHILSPDPTKTLCGRSVEVGGKPQLLLTTTTERSSGHVCQKCKQLKEGGTTVLVKKESAKIPGGNIRLLVKENPRRSGTKAHAHYALYKDGMKVEDFLKAGGTGGDLRWDLKRKHIEIK